MERCFDKRRHQQWKEALSGHAPGDSLPKWEAAQSAHISMMSNLMLTPLTWFRALLIRSAFTLVGNIRLEVAGILPVRLLWVKNEAVRAERPPGLAFHACPVLVTLLWILEDVGV